MIIKEIELNNFRIYKGVNTIDLTPDGDRNIIIVSGNNGFGKTTFLMSLVWCLYGRQMDKVDDLYRKEIEEKGGYSKYIGNSLNIQAKKEGETRFSVSVTFTDVEIPDVPCTDIKITRSYDSATNYDDELEIFIDGRKSDLFSGTKEDITKEEEIFIRDYILPIEIAKFFFFDAEKIVSFAQINTPEQRQDLSRAYSQVLGIQKYDDLKNELERIQDDYRRESAKPQERKEFTELIASIDYAESEISRLSDEISNLEDDRILQQHESKELQTKLIREGDLMTQEELEQLNKKRDNLSSEMHEAEDDLKDLYNLIPFGLSGGLISSILDQLKEEKAYKQNKLQLEGVNDKTDVILSDIENAKRDFNHSIDIKVRDFYESQIRKLIKKYFYNDLDNNRFEHFTMLHDFTGIQENDFASLVSKIKESKSSFDDLHGKYTKAKAELFSIERKIREAEKNAESDYVQELRKKKELIDRKIESIYRDIAAKENEKEELSDKIIANKKQKEILSKKIAVSNQNKAVDDEASRLIRTIQQFLIKFKEPVG
ncbi:AAA family ATPase [Alistipes senegalensis]|uniref:AAA family ATPase n=2 Tax=Alistipes senegalensis TaxID=1288121 RepID=A0ABY5V498_9BACT|nr:AAA family ATPase [Alistipes senegalensis]UEA87980.1 AAA family ATPase [Alistipes senegalensis]UWN64430.1 AAA family ATPase [Alistipes senegalensis JC50]